MASSSSSSLTTVSGGVNGLGIAGISSGLDTTDLVTKLSQYEQEPIDSENQQIQILQWKENDYRTQNTSLSNLQQTVSNLRLQAAYMTKTVSSSNQQVVNATAGTNGVDGTYSVAVSQLATYATNESSTGFLLNSTLVGSLKVRSRWIALIMHFSSPWTGSKKLSMFRLILVLIL